MTSVWIKVCGVTTEKCLDIVSRAGVNAVGFVFADSPRRLSPKRAVELADLLPRHIAKVAVFHNASARAIRNTLDIFKPDLIQTESMPTIQMLGSILPVFHDSADVYDRVITHTTSDQVLLLEAHGRGGRGIVPDWDRAAKIATKRRLILAGGLTPINIVQAIIHVRPYAVDVSSGVESSLGVKDASRVFTFVQRIRQAEALLP